MTDFETIPDYSENWYEDEVGESDNGYVDEYDITAAPNDFNVRTIYHFIESGAVKIPGFQRNYVWDQRRASKLIESIIIGLPIPQIFLYEESRNSFLVIDGQQRLMTLYYFIKQRFPKKEKRASLRAIFAEYGKIPDDILHDDHYFSKFNLRLTAKEPDAPNKFNKLNYSTLGDYKTQFDLRTIRNVIIKQNVPQDDDSSIYEIFNRLNSGGINLKPQEIRASLYHSNFYGMLAKINLNPTWRRFLGLEEPDLHMKDIEILLRGFAMLIEGSNYKPSMTKFLNGFSKNCKTLGDEQLKYLEKLFESFMTACKYLPGDAFLSKKQRFNISLYDATFAAICGAVFDERKLVTEIVQLERLKSLRDDQEFIDASQSDTARKTNVETRLLRARSILLA